MRHEFVMFEGHFNQSFIPHTHDVFTIALVTRGTFQVNIADRWRPVKTGDLLVVGADVLHAASPLSQNGWDMKILHVPPNAIYPPNLVEPKSMLHLDNPIITDGALVSRFLGLSELGRDNTVEGHIDSINEFCRWFEKNFEIFEPKVVPLRWSDQLESAKQLLLGSAFDDLQIEELAEELGISTFALIRIFKKHFGMPPHAWRIQVRIKEVAKQLESGVALVDAASNCGFFDQAHMSRLFKKVYGVTPGQYRAAGVKRSSVKSHAQALL